MVNKHILPLTYKPKIPDVRSGKCTQTIRPVSDVKHKQVGDWIMFHGWSGKPYRSPWSFRTPYWKIIYVSPIYFEDDSIFSVLPERELSLEDCENIAVQDGFVNSIHLLEQFESMYGDKMFDITFEIIRWNPNQLKG